MGHIVIIGAALQLTMLGLVDRACSESLGWVLLLVVLDPATLGPSVGVELAMTTRHNGVSNDGGSRGEHKF